MIYELRFPTRSSAGVWLGCDKVGAPIEIGDAVKVLDADLLDVDYPKIAIGEVVQVEDLEYEGSWAVRVRLSVSGHATFNWLPEGRVMKL